MLVTQSHRVRQGTKNISMAENKFWKCQKIRMKAVNHLGTGLCPVWAEVLRLHG